MALTAHNRTSKGFSRMLTAFYNRVLLRVHTPSLALLIADRISSSMTSKRAHRRCMPDVLLHGVCIDLLHIASTGIFAKRNFINITQ